MLFFTCIKPVRRVLTGVHVIKHIKWRRLQQANYLQASKRFYELQKNPYAVQYFLATGLSSNMFKFTDETSN